VAVSSNVDNPRDFPEHLVDGKEDTAWNGRTGDLVGATISFAVPQDAKITSLLLSAGFNKRSAKGDDLFAMNHRIAKITILRIARELRVEEEIKTWHLDTERREPQELNVALPGGIYMLRIDDVVPGTNAAWRELAVSEFAVMGIPHGAPVPHPAIPNVRLGKLSEYEDYFSEVRKFPLPYGQYAADKNALCSAFDRALQPALKAGAIVSPGPTPWCRLGAKFANALPAARSPASLKGIYAIELASEVGSEEGFALQTTKGWAVPAAGIWSTLPCPRGCMDDMVTTRVELEGIEMEGSSVRVHVKEVVNHIDGDPSVTTSWYALRCDLDATPLTCTRVVQKRACSSRGLAGPCP
jgi:hypothetical protein